MLLIEIPIWSYRGWETWEGSSGRSLVSHYISNFMGWWIMKYILEGTALISSMWKTIVQPSWQSLHVIASTDTNNPSNTPTIFHAVSAGEDQNGLAPREEKNNRYVDLIASYLIVNYVGSSSQLWITLTFFP